MLQELTTTTTTNSQKTMDKVPNLTEEQLEHIRQEIEKMSDDEIREVLEELRRRLQQTKEYIQ